MIYKVKFKSHWRVEWGRKKMGYPAWSKRVAVSAAKEMARDNRPSTVVIHDKKGKVLQEIPYEAKPYTGEVTTMGEG